MYGFPATVMIKRLVGNGVPSITILLFGIMEAIAPLESPLGFPSTSLGDSGTGKFDMKGPDCDSFPLESFVVGWGFPGLFSAFGFPDGCDGVLGSGPSAGSSFWPCPCCGSGSLVSFGEDHFLDVGFKGESSLVSVFGNFVILGQGDAGT